jgi:hypothetical protein
MSNNWPCNTGYEFCRIELKQLTLDEIKIADKEIGLCCGKCGSVESSKWFLERLINNYLPDYRIICEKCV